MQDSAIVEETEQEGTMSGGSSDEVRASQLEHQQNYGKERRPVVLERMTDRWMRTESGIRRALV